jgi:hypothetical protein
MSEHSYGAPVRVLDELASELERVRPRAQLVARRRRRTLISFATVVLVALMVGASFTPPGRAITGEIGRWMGIGDEPSDSRNRDAVVIGIGEQSSFRYEVVATGAAGHSPDTTHPTPCLSVEFPAIDGLVAASCLTDEVRQALARDSLSMPTVVGLPAELYPEADVMVQGLAAPAVDQAFINYVDSEDQPQTVTAAVSRLGPTLASKIEVADQTNSYVAFLPPDLLDAPSAPDDPLTTTAAARALSHIEVSGTGADGQQVGSVAASTGRAASLGLALQAPEARFSDHDELAAQCRRQLAGASEAEIEICVDEAVE